ncbi:MAG: metal ABC transporter permease [Burkholderiaceae bacterium]
MAEAEGLQPARGRLVFLLLLACVIAPMMKIVGVLMITALLIIRRPLFRAARLSHGPEAMAVISAACGMVSVLIGLLASLTWDTPTGPSIVVASLVLFLAGLLLAPGWRKAPGGLSR